MISKPQTIIAQNTLTK